VEQRRSQWNFATTDAGWTWTVTHADGTTESSEQAFKTLKECADDATGHGYVAWKPEDERRRELVLGVSKVLAGDAPDDK
jgi:hypothetical protein